MTGAALRGLVWHDPTSSEHYATAAGIVLLAKDPSAVFPQCRILADAYRTTEPDGQPRDHEDTRECHVLHADRALRAEDVLTWLQKAIDEHGAPEHLRSDNGPEFIAHAVQQWLRDNQIKTIDIDPGSPWQNGFVESFHGRFRDECLNREQLWTLTEARVVIEDYRHDDNQRRPHSRLGDQSPARFAAQLTPSPPAVGLRPPSVGDGQTQNPSLN